MPTPRRANRLRPWVWALLLWLTLAMWAQAARASEVLEVQRSAWRDGVALAEERVTLPDTLPNAWLDDRVRVVYHWRAEPSAQDEQKRALWVFRAGAPYRLLVNGEPAQRLLPLPPLLTGQATVFNGRSPALFALPNTGADIEIRLQTRPFMQHGLVQVQQGPVDALALLHTEEYARVADPVWVTVVLSGTLFVIALALWWARPRQVLLGLFAGLCGTAALRHWLLDWSGIGLPPLLFEHLNPYLIYCFVTMALGASWALVHALSPRRVRWLLGAWAVFTLASVVAVALERETLLLRNIVQLAGNVALIYIVGFTLRQRARIKASWVWAIALGYLLLFAGSVHDLGLTSIYTSPMHGTMIIWGFAAVVLAYAYVTADYVLGELVLARQSGEVLAQRVEAARQQLEHNFAALAQHDQREAARHERSLIMRELHDSLGAQLVTALRGVERDALSKGGVLQALHESLSSLRQLLSTQGADGRLVGALANWRQHWHDRLAQAGVEIAWAIDDSVDDLVLPPETLHQLLRILQECATNTLKHGHADRFRVSAHAEHGQLTLGFFDNGRGFGPQAPGSTGQGLTGMDTRAQQIGATLSRRNGPAPWGACVKLELAIEASAPSAPPPPPSPA